MSCLQMHFLADHAIESCHQSLAASQFRLLGVEGRLGRGEAGQARKKKSAAALCVRARPRWRQARARAEWAGLQPGFCQPPTRGGCSFSPGVWVTGMWQCRPAAGAEGARARAVAASLSRWRARAAASPSLPAVGT